jgi:hypothetical protein
MDAENCGGGIATISGAANFYRNINSRLWLNLRLVAIQSWHNRDHLLLSQNPGGVPMKHYKTALLAGAFALATTVAFAQVGAGGSTSGGASVGASPGSASGSTNTNAGANVNGSGANANVGASSSEQMKTKRNQTTGSGAAGGNIQLDTK